MSDYRHRMDILMDPVIALTAHSFEELTAADRECCVDALERGQVVCFPDLPFVLTSDEAYLLSPAVSGSSKNVSFDPLRGELRGSSADEQSQVRLQEMIARFSNVAAALVDELLPEYRAALTRGRTSFRPQEIEGRSTSWRKDDTRLHVDSFPSSPTAGRRILRVFSNVNPDGQDRVWRIGEPFEDVARRFLPSVRRPVPGASQVMSWMRITKRRRTAYDHFMLGLHDHMKRDLSYQARAPQHVHQFPPGSTWMVFTDQVSHAAMRGQHVLEQTFLLDVQALRAPERCPLGVLARMLGRPLV